MSLGTVCYIGPEKAKLHAAGLLVYANNYQKKALEASAHIFRAMTGPERLRLKSECVVCQSLAEIGCGDAFEFVMLVGEDDSECKNIGLICPKCVDLSRGAKNESVRKLK
jgi:hypothetical protein